MTNPVGPGSTPPQAGAAPSNAPNAAGQITPAGAGGPTPQNWGPAWSQFQDLMGSPQNMAIFQKTLLNNMANTMQENQNRYEANQQQIKELFPDLNQ